MFADKNKLFYIILGLFFILNAVIGSLIELSFDESYYWVYSEYLSLGYFDHPPMVAAFIKMGTFLFGQNEFSVRFMANISMCGTLCLIWHMLNKQHLLLFMVSVLSMPLINFSGLLALPDAPLLFFGTLYFYTLKKYLKNQNLQQILLLAIAIAGMFYSKYHGLLIVLLTVIANPQMLKSKSFYLVALFSFILFLPHLYWQYQHDFVSFKFHLTGRVEKHFSLSNIFDYIGGQVGLLGIFNFFIFLSLFLKQKFKDDFERILLFNSFGFLIFLFMMSFRNQIEANWTVTVCVACIVLFLPRLSSYQKGLYIKLSILPVFLGFVLKGALLAAPYVVSITDIKDNRLHEIVNWKNGKILEVARLCEGNLIVADSYQIAAKLSFYLKRKIPALHLNSRESHYSILNLQRNIAANQEICFLSSKARVKSLKIETNYKDPIFLAPRVSLAELAKANGTTYEKIIRK